VMGEVSLAVSPGHGRRQCSGCAMVGEPTTNCTEGGNRSQINWWIFTQD